MPLYMRELISEEEAEVLLADLKNQVANLRLLIGSVESDLCKREERKLAAMNTEAWLMTLRKNLTEVEQDTEEAYLHRRKLVKLLVEKITVDSDEYGRAGVHITYRFGPPPEGTASFVDGVRNSRESWWVGIEAERADGGPKVARDGVQLATPQDGER
jgi:hypothetical protein